MPGWESQMPRTAGVKTARMWGAWTREASLPFKGGSGDAGKGGEDDAPGRGYRGDVRVGKTWRSDAHAA